MYQDVFVFCEQRDGNIQNIAFELIGKGRELADSLGQKVVAVLPGYQIADRAQSLIAHGADKVILADKPILAEYSTKPYTDVMAKVIADYHPEIFLFGASSIGRDLAPSVSATIHTGLTADCTGLAIGDVVKNVNNAADKAVADQRIAELGTDATVEDKSKVMTGKDGQEIQIVNVVYTYHNQLRMTRPAFGGNIIATIACLQHRPQMATVRPGVMQALPAETAKPMRSRRMSSVSWSTPSMARFRLPGRRPSRGPLPCTPGISSSFSKRWSRSPCRRALSSASSAAAMAAASPRPTMPAVFSVPARRPRSCSPP